jgi:hypothetical protein
MAVANTLETVTLVKSLIALAFGRGDLSGGIQKGQSKGTLLKGKAQYSPPQSGNLFCNKVKKIFSI